MITLKCRESEESDFDMSILECVPTNPEQAPADPANAQSDPETNSADRRLNPEVLDTEIPSHELEDTEEHSPEGEEKAGIYNLAIDKNYKTGKNLEERMGKEK